MITTYYTETFRIFTDSDSFESESNSNVLQTKDGIFPYICYPHLHQIARSLTPGTNECIPHPLAPASRNIASTIRACSRV